MAKLSLSLSCGNYEITRPLIEGAVQADGIDLTVLASPAARDRQWRLGRASECDVAELNLCAYFMARDRGHPYIALPIYPHRRFRHGFIFVRSDAAIEQPSDLRGRRIGVESGFQPAAAVWLRGILEEFHGLPHKDVIWVTDREEDIPFAPHPQLRIERASEDASLQNMLLEGKLEALISPDYPAAFLSDSPKVRQLFSQPQEEEIKYYRETGIFPIMHILMMRENLVRDHLWAASSICSAFNEAKRVANQRLKNPRVLPIAWHSDVMREQSRILGPDPWRYGLGKQNRQNLEAALRYTFEQGLISRTPSLDEVLYNISEEAISGTPAS